MVSVLPIMRKIVCVLYSMIVAVIVYKINW
jgi:hypothetical protein